MFEKDLKPEGYEYVSLGPSSQLRPHGQLRLAEDHIVREAAKCAVNLLSEPEKLRRITQKNFMIAQSHHDVTVLRQDMEHMLQSLNIKKYLSAHVLQRARSTALLHEL